VKSGVFGEKSLRGQNFRRVTVSKRRRTLLETSLTPAVVWSLPVIRSMTRWTAKARNHQKRSSVLVVVARSDDVGECSQLALVRLRRSSLTFTLGDTQFRLRYTKML
jgi:hypothetical protein